MKRWTTISTTDETARWTALSARLNAQGSANEFVPWTGPTADFTDLSSLDDFAHVRISSRLGPGIAARLKVQSTWTTLLGVVDGMTRTDHGWWPLCALHEAFGQLLIELGRDLDPRGSVLVAGAGGAARTAISAFFKAGFTQFLISNLDEAEAQAMITDVRRRLFGLKLEWTPTDRIVMLGGECSVVINATADVTENKLLTELSYLNFLKRTGYVFDLGRTRTPSVLVDEAREAKLGLVTGVEVAARADKLWAKWAFGIDLELDQLRADVEQSLT